MSKADNIGCTLTAEEQRIRRSRVRAEFVPQVRHVIAITNGLRLEFESSDELRSLIEEFIALEKGCCGFLTFCLSEYSEGLMLLIQGPPEAAEVIDTFLKTLRRGKVNE